MFFNGSRLSCFYRVSNLWYVSLYIVHSSLTNRLREMCECVRRTELCQGGEIKQDTFRSLIIHALCPNFEPPHERIHHFRRNAFFTLNLFCPLSWRSRRPRRRRSPRRRRWRESRRRTGWRRSAWVALEARRGRRRTVGWACDPPGWWGCGTGRGGRCRTPVPWRMSRSLTRRGLEQTNSRTFINTQASSLQETVWMLIADVSEATSTPSQFE